MQWTDELDVLTKLIQRVGYPVVVSLILLTQIVPKIDHGVAIADEVNGKLNYMVYTCGGKP